MVVGGRKLYVIVLFCISSAYVVLCHLVLIFGRQSLLPLYIQYGGFDSSVEENFFLVFELKQQIITHGLFYVIATPPSNNYYVLPECVINVHHLY